jgi:hypothetical protein
MKTWQKQLHKKQEYYSRETMKEYRNYKQHANLQHGSFSMQTETMKDITELL